MYIKWKNSTSLISALLIQYKYIKTRFSSLSHSFGHSVSDPALRALRCYRKTDASIQWLLQTYKSKYRSQGGAKMLLFMYIFEV